MSKFTPGPWDIVPTPRSSYQTHRIERNKCTIARIGDALEEGDFNANAKLIAAAPAMYEALQKIIDQEQHDGQPETHMHDMADFARAALKAATGE